jgi:hypothetical protein
LKEVRRMTGDDDDDVVDGVEVDGTGYELGDNDQVRGDPEQLAELDDSLRVLESPN